MSHLVELRKLRFEITKIGYELGALKVKIKLEPARTDLKRIRAQLIRKLGELNDRHAELLPKIESAPYSRTDLADLIDKLADIESQIVHGGTEQGHGAIRAHIEWLLRDAERLDAMGAR